MRFVLDDDRKLKDRIQLCEPPLIWSMVSSVSMQPPLSDATKRAVIQEYLRGKNRLALAL